MSVTLLVYVPPETAVLSPETPGEVGYQPLRLLPGWLAELTDAEREVIAKSGAIVPTYESAAACEALRTGASRYRSVHLPAATKEALVAWAREKVATNAREEQARITAAERWIASGGEEPEPIGPLPGPLAQRVAALVAERRTRAAERIALTHREALVRWVAGLDAAEKALPAVVAAVAADDPGAFDHGNSRAYLARAAVVRHRRDVGVAAYAEMRNRWAVQHGSMRLRLAIEHGIECDAIYRDERLAYELPGWSWDAEETATAAWRSANAGSPYAGKPARWSNAAEARNPPLEALEALSAAKAKHADATLLHLSLFIEAPDDPDADADGEVYGGSVYVLRTALLSRDVFRAVAFVPPA